MLEPIATGATRLMVRGRVGEHWPGGGGTLSPAPRPIERIYWLLAHVPRWLPAAAFGHCLMQARQLREIKRRAESPEAHGEGHDPTVRMLF